jgi:hypothetical protein
MTAAVTAEVKIGDVRSAACCEPHCRFVVSHDRRAGDLTDPAAAAARHVEETGHPVTVMHTVRVITELEPEVAA